MLGFSGRGSVGSGLDRREEAAARRVRVHRAVGSDGHDSRRADLYDGFGLFGVEGADLVDRQHVERTRVAREEREGIATSLHRGSGRHLDMAVEHHARAVHTRDLVVAVIEDDDVIAALHDVDLIVRDATQLAVEQGRRRVEVPHDFARRLGHPDASGVQLDLRRRVAVIRDREARERDGCGDHDGRAGESATALVRPAHEIH